MSDSLPAIDLRELCKHYRMRTRRRRFSLLGGLGGRQGLVRAVDGVTLSVARGEMLGIVGMNGSGKSTLLKLISGITSASSGSVTVRGRIASLLEVGAGFHPELSGYENVYLNGTIMGLDRTAIDDGMADIVAFAQLDDFMNMPVKHFSLGMTLRLGFAIATQVQPDVLLLDETMAVGDAEFQARAVSAIQKFRESGTTILMVSHDIFGIRDQCERVLWLHEGRPRQLGPPQEVVHTYRSWLNRLPGMDVEHMLAMRGDELYDQPKVDQSPVQITSLALRDDKDQSPPCLNHPRHVTVRVEYRAEHLVPAARLCLGVVRRKDQAVVLDRDSAREKIPVGPLEGQGAIEITFPTESWYSDGFRVIAAFFPQGVTDRVYDRKTAEFDIAAIPQQEPEGFCYISNPWQRMEHRAQGTPACTPPQTTS